MGTQDQIGGILTMKGDGMVLGSISHSGVNLQVMTQIFEKWIRDIISEF